MLTYYTILQSFLMPLLMLVYSQVTQILTAIKQDWTGQADIQKMKEITVVIPDLVEIRPLHQRSQCT